MKIFYSLAKPGRKLKNSWWGGHDNRTTLWYQQKNVREGKTIRIYNKTRVKIK